VKVGYGVHMFPVDAAEQILHVQALSFLFGNALDVICSMECAGFAIIQAKDSASCSVLHHVLPAYTMLEDTFVPLNVIGNLSKLGLIPLRGISYLLLQSVEARVRQRIERITSGAIADAIAKPAKDAFHIDMGLTCKSHSPSGSARSPLAYRFRLVINEPIAPT
jgi:hypothetical protein